MGKKSRMKKERREVKLSDEFINTIRSKLAEETDIFIETEICQIGELPQEELRELITKAGIRDLGSLRQARWYEFCSMVDRHMWYQRGCLTRLTTDRVTGKVVRVDILKDVWREMADSGLLPSLLPDDEIVEAHLHDTNPKVPDLVCNYICAETVDDISDPVIKKIVRKKKGISSEEAIQNLEREHVIN